MVLVRTSESAAIFLCCICYVLQAKPMEFLGACFGSLQIWVRYERVSIHIVFHTKKEGAVVLYPYLNTDISFSGIRQLLAGLESVINLIGQNSANINRVNFDWLG